MYEELNRKIKQANRRITLMKKFFGKNGHSSLKFVSKSIEKAYGEDIGKYLQIKGEIDKKTLRRVELGVDALLNSPYSTAKGRKALHGKIVNTIVEKLNTDSRKFTKADAERMMDVFENEQWEKIRSRSGSKGSGLDVDQLADLVQSGVSEEDIIYLMDDFIQSGKVKNFTTYIDRTRRVMKEYDKVKGKDSPPLTITKASELLRDGDGSVDTAIKLFGSII